MKRALIIVAIAVASTVCLLIWYGDRILAGRYTVGRYTYSLIGKEPVSEKVILEGIPLALEHNRMNPKDWTAAPAPRSNAGSELGSSDGKPSSSLIILSNQINGTRLFVRVEAASSNSLNYHLYRPK